MTRARGPASGTALTLIGLVLAVVRHVAAGGTIGPVVAGETFMVNPIALTGVAP